MKEKYVNIALNIPVDKLFTYKVPENLCDEIDLGLKAIVNFGKKILTGVVVEILNKNEIGDITKVKEIKSIISDGFKINEELLKFCLWLSEYYVTPAGESIFLAIPRITTIESEITYSLHENYKENINKLYAKDEFLQNIIDLFLKKKFPYGIKKKQIEKALNIKDASKYLQALIKADVLTETNSYSKSIKDKFIKIVRSVYSENELKEIIIQKKIKSRKQLIFLQKICEIKKSELSALINETGISYASVNSLLKKELITIEEIKKENQFIEIYSEEQKVIELNNVQKNCLEEIISAIDGNKFKPFLLHGVTGSGKTEIYIQAFRYLLTQNKSAILLVPEISLTPQLIHRFRVHFGNKVGVIHSKLYENERIDTYKKIISGDYKIVIGARSALFSPLKNIGLIIVDEEHDSSYKQENSPRYQARDSAVMRANFNNAVVILGSATPSVESYYNAVSGKYKLLSLPERATKINMPEIKIIDVKSKESFSFDKNSREDFFDFIDKIKIKFLSKELIFEIGERLEKKENVIILQNKRGFHSYLECAKCGTVEMCPRCSIALTFHKSINLLKCHFCGFSKNVIKNCSECNSEIIIPRGTGTERVEEELLKIFPKATIERVDSDVITSAKKMQTVLKNFYDGKIDILVGTQMISKGMDFPNVTLVGVVNSDIGLLYPDFRATEKTFQILTQVAGRSGRSQKKGEVIIQTSHPEYYVFEKVRSYDYTGFFESELKTRKELNYPPFSRIAIVETKSVDKNLCESKIKEIYNFVKNFDRKKYLEILPPAPPLFSKLKDHYRFHLLIKSGKINDPGGNYLIGILNAVKKYSAKNIPSKVRVIIDMDAINLL